MIKKFKSFIKKTNWETFLIIYLIVAIIICFFDRDWSLLTANILLIVVSILSIIASTEGYKKISKNKQKIYTTVWGVKFHYCHYICFHWSFYFNENLVCNNDCLHRCLLINKNKKVIIDKIKI